MSVSADDIERQLRATHLINYHGWGIFAQVSADDYQRRAMREAL